MSLGEGVDDCCIRAPVPITGEPVLDEPVMEEVEVLRGEGAW